MKRPVVSIRILLSRQTLNPQGGHTGRQTFAQLIEGRQQVLGDSEGLLLLVRKQRAWKLSECPGPADGANIDRPRPCRFGWMNGWRSGRVSPASAVRFPILGAATRASGGSRVTAEAKMTGRGGSKRVTIPHRFLAAVVLCNLSLAPVFAHSG